MVTAIVSLIILFFINFLHVSFTFLESNTIPTVPANDNIKPTSYIIKGFIHKRIIADTQILFIVFDFLDNIIDKMVKIPMIPARATDAEAPEIKINIIIDIIIK